MVSDLKDNVVTLINQPDEDPKSLIDALNEDKLKLLKEKKYLLNLIAQKDEQLIKLSENYQRKWENVCNYLRSVDELCNELNISDNRILDLRGDNRTITDSPMDLSYSNSSYFTVTETEDSNFTTSSESLVATTETMKRTFKPKETFLSLNSLSNFHDPMDSGDNDSGDLIYRTSVRPQSHCPLGAAVSKSSMNNNTGSGISASIDSANSEPQFRIPDAPSPKWKHPTRKSSIVHPEKVTIQVEKVPNADKSFAEFTDKDLWHWLINIVRLPKSLVDDLKQKRKLDGICMDQISEAKLSKIFGTSDKLIRKKIMLGLEETRSSHNRENIPDSDLSRKDHLWVANVWLKKHLGLGHLSQAFLARCVDGRLLKYIASHARQKELITLATSNYDSCSGIVISPLNLAGKNISEPSKSDIRSIKYGLELLSKFKFDLAEVDKRRVACEKVNLDVLVWTNERVAKWFHKMNLKNYIRGIEYSGIHGGIMVLDPQFSMATMSKLLQIPTEVVKKNNLDDKFSSLLKPSRFNEGVKNRRSTSLFRRRSFSQPRHSKSQLNTNGSKTSTGNLEGGSDTVSINDYTQTSTLKPMHKERSQTIDLSRSTNQNFIRKYRKPNEDSGNRQKSQPQQQHHQQPLQSDSSDTNNLIAVQGHFLKSPAPKVTVYSAQISRKSKTKSISESENSEDL